MNPNVSPLSPLDESRKIHLAANPNSPESLLLSFIGDANSQVRDSLTQNPKFFDADFFTFPQPCPATYLRLATPHDAPFILFLRTDAARNQYLSATSPDILAQQEWLKKYKERERCRQEFYFILCDKTNDSLGTARIYDFQADSFCWGSWLISKNAPVSTAIASALTIYELGFYLFGFSKCHFDVRRLNQKVIDFHLRFGAKIISEDNLNYYFNFDKTSYESIKKRYSKFFA